MESIACVDFGVFDRCLISELLAAEDELDLVYAYAFLLLQCELDLVDSITRLEGQVLLLSRESLYRNLHFRRRNALLLFGVRPSLFLCLSVCVFTLIAIQINSLLLRKRV